MAADPLRVTDIPHATSVRGDRLSRRSRQAAHDRHHRGARRRAWARRGSRPRRDRRRVDRCRQARMGNRAAHARRHLARQDPDLSRRRNPDLQRRHLPRDRVRPEPRARIPGRRARPRPGDGRGIERRPPHEPRGKARAHRPGAALPGSPCGAKSARRIPTKTPASRIDERCAAIARELEAGADKVILEARESGTVGIYDRSGRPAVEMIQRIVEQRRSRAAGVRSAAQGAAALDDPRPRTSK